MSLPRAVRRCTPVLLAAGTLAIGLLTAGGLARACDTPVYRYAMYRWEPAPYEIYYFHQEPIEEGVADLHAALQAAGKSEQQPANVFFRVVNLAEDSELKTVPPDVRQRWQALEEAQTPSYLIVNPHGVPIHRGQLQSADLAPLLDSPARQEIVKELSQGKAGVLTLLTGTDEAANAEAEKLLQEFVADVASGKVELYLPPSGGFFAPAEAEPAAEPPAPQIEVGYVKVDRQDLQEKWLVESLLAMEDDLRDAEFADKPMMFAVFGRGRALPPCVGKGINRDNLLDCVDFVTGACSCTVKDQNPGMDLLMAADWQQTAQKMAAKFGSEEGSEFQLAAEDFFPDLIIPAMQPDSAGSSQELADRAAATEVGEAAAEVVETEVLLVDAAVERPAATSQARPAPGPRPQLSDGGEVSAAGAVEDTESAPISAEAQPSLVHAADPVRAASHGSGSDPEEGSALRGALIVGAGVGIAFILLFGVTFLVLRPR